MKWLPNQLQAVLNQMDEVGKYCDAGEGVERILGLVELQRNSLAKEVERYCKERGVMNTPRKSPEGIRHVEHRETAVA